MEIRRRVSLAAAMAHPLRFKYHPQPLHVTCETSTICAVAMPAGLT